MKNKIVNITKICPYCGNHTRRINRINRFLSKVIKCDNCNFLFSRVNHTDSFYFSFRKNRNYLYVSQSTKNILQVFEVYIGFETLYTSNSLIDCTKFCLKYIKNIDLL